MAFHMRGDGTIHEFEERSNQKHSCPGEMLEQLFLKQTCEDAGRNTIQKRKKREKMVPSSFYIMNEQNINLMGTEHYQNS